MITIAAWPRGGREGLASDVRENGREVEIVNVRRRQERSAKTRQKIISAATTEFAFTGFDGASTRSIAERAKVQHGLVIYHFETKLGVWKAVMENALNHFHSEIKRFIEEVEGCDDVTRLRQFQKAFIRISATRPELNWLLSHEVREESSRLSWIIEKIAGRDIEEAIELIRKVQALGRYVEGDPAHLHYLFVGAATRVFMVSGEIKRTMKQSPFDEAFLERHIEMCERLFFRDPHRNA